jgi:hypothetical protein
MILGSVVLAVAMAGPAEADQTARGKICGAIQVSSPEQQQQQRARGTFSASRTLDLSFRMTLRNLDADAHLVTFRIFTPNGHLYQEIQVVTQAAPGQSGATVSAQIPVAGTAIPTNSLFGRWSVAPHFDDSPRTCAPAAVFTIVE